jgi:methionyl-tRNA formyltransferase
MNVLLLSPYPELLKTPIDRVGDTSIATMDEPEKWPSEVDFIVSFGYRHIIRDPYLLQFKNRLINIHTSLLPWNRGAYPNFWSWYDGTPKGVSIHLIEGKIDRGPCLAQTLSPPLPPKTTLRESHSNQLCHAAILFASCWADFRKQRWKPIETNEEGSFHTIAETEPLLTRLPNGWDTTVAVVEMMGQLQREADTENKPTVH